MRKTIIGKTVKVKVSSRYPIMSGMRIMLLAFSELLLGGYRLIQMEYDRKIGGVPGKEGADTNAAPAQVMRFGTVTWQDVGGCHFSYVHS
jgi:hypothetical protein